MRSDQRTRSWRRAATCGAAAALLLLWWTACTSIRRPDAGEGPSWDTSSATPPTGEDSVAAAVARAAADSSVKVARILRHQRSSSDKARVTAVNRYAYWCIGKDMWNEARSHLERAVAEDSVAASLANNLAIVYEHFGESDKAVHLYARAAALEPDNQEYRANLKRLDDLERSAADTTGSIDIFELRRRAPMGSGGPTRPE